MNGISAFIKEIPARRPIYKLGSGLSSDMGSYQNIDSGLFGLRTVRNACLLWQNQWSMQKGSCFKGSRLLGRKCRK